MNTTEWEPGITKKFVYGGDNKINVTVEIFHHQVETYFETDVDNVELEQEIADAFQEYATHCGSIDSYHVEVEMFKGISGAVVVPTYDMNTEQQQFDKLQEHIKRLDRVFNKIGYYKSGDSK